MARDYEVNEQMRSAKRELRAALELRGNNAADIRAGRRVRYDARAQGKIADAWNELHEGCLARMPDEWRYTIKTAMHAVMKLKRLVASGRLPDDAAFHVLVGMGHAEACIEYCERCLEDWSTMTPAARRSWGDGYGY
jgi:hypothetical protein